MKKIITLIIFPLFLFAELDISKVNSALLSITSSKTSSKPLTFYNNNRRINLKRTLTITSQNLADIILFPKQKKKTDKAFVSDSYKVLKRYKNSIGAIYIKKGRTQIVFVKERLEKKGFHLNEIGQKYLIEECALEAICLAVK